MAGHSYHVSRDKDNEQEVYTFLLLKELLLGFLTHDILFFTSRNGDSVRHFYFTKIWHLFANEEGICVFEVGLPIDKAQLKVKGDSAKVENYSLAMIEAFENY